jgi:hypothetical protein
MAALDFCSQRNSAGRSKTDLLAELEEEKAGRLLLLLQAYWYPSTNKSFELLAGKTGRYTYFLFARNEKVICEDLYGAFCAIYQPGAEETRRTSELIALVPLPKVDSRFSPCTHPHTGPGTQAPPPRLAWPCPHCAVALEQDVAVYAWDLGSLMTQASYFLTFVSSAGFPASVVAPYRQRVEELLAFPELARGELPSMEHLSEVLSKITFEGVCKAHAVLCLAAKKLAPDARLAVEPLLSEEGQEKCFSQVAGPSGEACSQGSGLAQLLTPDETMSEGLRTAIAMHNLIVEASRQQLEEKLAVPTNCKQSRRGKGGGIRHRE